MNLSRYNFPVGSVISVLKMNAIDHVGLVVAPNKVAHASPKNGIAIISTIEEFCEGQMPKLVRTVANISFAISRAYELIKKGYKYDLAKTNCEHFVTDCESGNPKSDQLKKWSLRLGLAGLVIYLIFKKGKR